MFMTTLLIIAAIVVGMIANDIHKTRQDRALVADGQRPEAHDSTAAEKGHTYYATLR